MPSTTILITDGEQRAALAVVRSLGRAGYRVDVCSTRGRSLAGASRHARCEFAVPDPLHEPSHFAEAVAGHCRDRAVDVLLPIAEPALLALLQARDSLAPVRIPFPSLGRFRAISDKEALTEAAARLGIRVPEQRVLHAPAEAERQMDSFRFPLVLKPARSVGEAGGQRLKVGVRYAMDPGALRRELSQLPAQAFPLLLQQRVVGPGVGIFLLRWQGRRVATFAHRRLREKPPSGGVSVYRESIPADPALVELSEALLAAFDWDGVAMVEYKIEEATGTPYLMEVNGRFWGSLQLAVDAGVDFPRLLVECALGREPRPCSEYRSGVRSRWWWGDFDHLLARMRRSADALALPPGAPGRGRVLRDFLTLWKPGDHSEVFRFADPVPALRESIDWLRRR
ncbi:MAG: ATP-grasp domain-containing protein [Gemmatimonadetes bacterium]|nr:ATP-grasp domain-containing protein [Gemmatimonadota bacterium]